MKIGILAVQGAFTEHEKCLKQLGVESILLRNQYDLDKDFDGLILPGGESTVQGKLLQELHMFEPLSTKISNGLPVFATCAGLILLAQQLSNDETAYFRTLPVTVKRNAYGRQLGSFFTVSDFGDFQDIPMKFIRAPYIEEILCRAKDMEILAEINEKIVGVRYKKQIGVAFHPELTEDLRIHKMFLDLINH